MTGSCGSIGSSADGREATILHCSPAALHNKRCWRALQAVAGQLERAHREAPRSVLLFLTLDDSYLMVDGAAQVQPALAVRRKHRALVDQACGFLPTVLPAEDVTPTHDCSHDQA